jgi:branched-chain amino acid transport system ATP-binding protein
VTEAALAPDPPIRTEPVLSLERVSSFYGDLQALFDVSLEVAEGETVAIVGANGAGKSTLLKVVAGLQVAATGEVRYQGRSLGPIRAHDRVRPESRSCRRAAASFPA